MFPVHSVGQLCTKSHEAKDISSYKDMQDNLLKESDDDTTVSAGASFAGFAFSSKNAFSKSEKLKQFKQQTEDTQSVSFETSAKCIDYQIEINPYAILKLNADFESAVDGLPAVYDDTNTTTRATYHKFLRYDISYPIFSCCTRLLTNMNIFLLQLRAYGTHYISQLDIGGKVGRSHDSLY